MKRVESKVRFGQDFYSRLHHAMIDRGRKSMQAVIEEALEAWIAGGNGNGGHAEGGGGAAKDNKPRAASDLQGAPPRDSTLAIPAKDTEISNPFDRKTEYSSSQPNRETEELLIAARRVLMHPLVGSALATDIISLDLMATLIPGNQQHSATAFDALSDPNVRRELAIAYADANTKRGRAILKRNRAIIDRHKGQPYKPDEDLPGGGNR